MSDSYTESLTHTFTTADVGKVIDCFAADLDGMGQSTGLRTHENTKAVAADVKLMAQHGYLSEVNIYLKDANGNTIRAAKYVVSTDGSFLTASRPGNYLWPWTPRGQLFVHVTYNSKWWNLSQTQRDNFKRQLQQHWGTLNLDTSFPMLTCYIDRNYVSNGFGLKKSVFM